MVDIVSAVVTGLMIGLVYALIASSLNIIFGVMRIVNFAHGNFLILAAYSSFWLWELFDIDPLTSLVAVVPIFFVLGLVAYYLTVPRLLNADDTEMMSFLVYFGLSIVLAAGMRIVWGSQTRAIPTPYEGTLPLSVQFLGQTYATSRVIGSVVSVVLLSALVWFLYRTYYGMAIRALIQNREATKFLGIETHRVSAYSFGIGMALAGVAGTLLTLIFPAFAATGGQNYTIIAFSIIVMGGLGDPIGAMIGGVVFALVEQVAMLFLPLSASPLIAFVVLVAIIMLRPEGLFRVQDVRGALADLRGRGGG
ncbi:MAG: branched-chain amino acid ABC transporter permease [Haloarculaceae archaeon]|jgi:branched-chain amino acid transport system permease protein